MALAHCCVDALSTVSIEENEPMPARIHNVTTEMMYHHVINAS